MNVQVSEAAVLQTLRPKYESQGYEVVRERSVPELPKEFASYIPDLVMKKGDKYLAIEVKTRRIPSVHRRLEALKKAIERNPRWSFKIIYSDDVDAPRGPAIQSLDEVQKALGEVQDMLDADQVIGAFLLAWGAFEAASRLLYSRIFAKPQMPGRLVTVLAEKGVLDTDMAKELRELLDKRNRLIHGELNIALRKPEVLTMIAVTRRILEHVR